MDGSREIVLPWSIVDAYVRTSPVHACMEYRSRRYNTTRTTFCLQSSSLTCGWLARLVRLFVYIYTRLFLFNNANATAMFSFIYYDYRVIYTMRCTISAEQVDACMHAAKKERKKDQRGRIACAVVRCVVIHHMARTIRDPSSTGTVVVQLAVRWPAGKRRVD